MVMDQMKCDAVDPLIDDYEKKLIHFKKSMFPAVHFFSVPMEEFVPDKKYDMVFCMNAINHVSDLHLSFRQLGNYTKQNGWLVITIDAHNHSFFKHLFRLVPGDILHPHQFDLTEYKKLIEYEGFVISKTITIKKEFFLNDIF